MHSSTLIFAIVIGFLLFASTFASSSLKCWVCTSITDTDCNEDSFPWVAQGSIVKTDCSNVQTTSISGHTAPRTVPATACIKSVIKAKGGAVVVLRTCAPPNDKGANDAKCETTTSANGNLVETKCYCTDNYCNGSESLKLAGLLTILPLGLCLLFGRYKF